MNPDVPLFGFIGRLDYQKGEGEELRRGGAGVG